MLKTQYNFLSSFLIWFYSFEGGFAGGSPYAPPPSAWSPAPPAQPSALHTALTDMTLTVRLHDLDNLTVSKETLYQLHEKKIQ